MPQPDDADLFETTRGKLLLLLCGGPRTVNELMDTLGVTDNAVRAQLANLQQAGLVVPVGLRPGTRKPHVDYELTPKARRLLPQAHEQVLGVLVIVLQERLPPEQVRALLSDVARRVLEQWVSDLREREPRGRLAELFRRLSHVAPGMSLQEGQGGATMSACGCPLASVTATHPQVCEVLAEVLGDVLGAPVRECCERTDTPRCRFQLQDPAR